MKQLFTIISYLALFLFSLTTYAYGPGVTLLSSKIDMSQGMQGGFIDQSVLSLLTSNGGAQAYAKANPVYGKKANNILINGTHAYLIQNQTGRAQQYTIEYKLSLSDGRFIRKTDTVLIRDNATDRGAALSYTNQYFPSPGTFRYTVETSVHGEHSDHKSDNNNVYVT